MIDVYMSMQKKYAKIQLIDKALNGLAAHHLRCRLCPRACSVNRQMGERGFCGIGSLPVVSHFCLHFGEEPPLSGYYDYKGDVSTGSSSSGSGAIFFAGCNLKCIFCQNYQISRRIHGSIASIEALASAILSLQERGALNINLVTPTHVILPTLEALKIAFSHGLRIPLVYNTSAYESIETIAQLSGIVDIYLPDFKFFNEETARRFSNAPDYPERASEAIKGMYAQVGNLELDGEGNARKGMIVRHLILPDHTEESCSILEWISANLSNQVPVSLMSQFYPCNTVPDEINRRITREEYERVRARAEEIGFENLYLQAFSFEPDDHLLPDFEREDPFPWGNREKGHLPAEHME
jgi:putative pyruvate formate lyase activating enzyme